MLSLTSKKEYLKQYYLDNKDAYKERGQRYERKLKLDALMAYGGQKCACCTETLFEFLTLDHSKGRTEDLPVNKLRGTHLYRWLRKHGYPKDTNLRVLCGNCNFSLGTYGFCPHQRQESSLMVRR